MSAMVSVVLFLAAIAVYSFKAGRNTFWFSLILLLLTLFIVLNVTLVASNYFTGDGINDAVLYTLTNSLTGAGVSKYVVPAIGLIIALFSLFCLLSWLLRRKKTPHHLGWSLLAIACAAGSVQTTPAFRQVKELIASHSRLADSDFETYYKTPNKVIAEPKLNLVYIYGESLERTYFDQQAFPGLAPELSREKDNSIDFSHTEQLPGTDYTIAGMVASQCGIPLFAPFDGNASASLSSFYPQNICLGDILKNSGYENWFIQGADLRFAGKDTFLLSHGFDAANMYGSQELKSRVADASYRNNWGYYDDTVMDEVFEKYEELSRAQKRFALFTLTVDTHHPDGFISRSCQRKSYSYDGKPNQSFSAVALIAYLTWAGLLNASGAKNASRRAGGSPPPGAGWRIASRAASASPAAGSAPSAGTSPLGSAGMPWSRRREVRRHASAICLRAAFPNAAGSADTARCNRQVATVARVIHRALCFGAPANSSTRWAVSRSCDGSERNAGAGRACAAAAAASRRSASCSRSMAAEERPAYRLNTSMTTMGTATISQASTTPRETISPRGT